METPTRDDREDPPKCLSWGDLAREHQTFGRAGPAHCLSSPQAMTRAKKMLVLTTATTRLTWGVKREMAPSRFLDEIPPHLVKTLVIPNKATQRRRPGRSPAGSGTASGREGRRPDSEPTSRSRFDVRLP